MNFTIPIPQIAIDCPMLHDLFLPENIDSQIAKYSHDPRSQSLAILKDWKKVLQEEMAPEEFNSIHQLTDLA